MYKILKNNMVIDAIESLVHVRQNIKNKVIITCKPEFSNGIISYDQTVIWHLDGQPDFISGDFETVTAVKIDEGEYKAIREVLDGNTETNEPEEVREPLANTAVMELVSGLKVQVQDLMTKNQQLESRIDELGL